MALPPNPMGSMIDSGLMQGGPQEDLPSVDMEVSAPMDFSGGADISPDGQGGAIITALQDMLMGEEEDALSDMPHGGNLAEVLDPAILGEVSSELVAMYEEDMDSRSEWEEAYTSGLDLLGIKYENRTQPFEGASGITHPLISESVTQFQAQAYKELLPSGGPVRTDVIGLRDYNAEAQATRVKDYMNYQITEVMEEFDPDTDQMLFYLPLSGSTFKKVYFDLNKNRAVAKFIPAQDLVVPYSASDLMTSPRVTHVLRMEMNDIRKMQVAGVYRDIELSDTGSSSDTVDPIREKVNKLEGISRSYTDEVHTVLEMHVDLDLEGFEDLGDDDEPTGIKLPYVVTIDKDSSEILSIQRNWKEDDARRSKIQYFVHYKFMPGLGFYGFGLIHMIGGLGRAATSILRQLIDAGTLSNLPAGFKARGVRLRNQDEPIQPGEWRDIDAPGGNIRDAIIPLPYKEPSATLGQLLGSIVDSGRRFISIADNLSEPGGQEMPVGTTIALLERGTRVMSAIHKRLHYAQKTEFRLLARIFADNLPPEYPYEVAGAPRQIKAQDFDNRIDVLPVSDPNIFSMAQRVTLAQQQLTLAQSNPQMHNLYAAYRRMYSALEVQNIDEILPPPEEPQPKDPVTENMEMLQGMLQKAFPDQNHDAHVQAHTALYMSPIVMTSPPIQGSLYGHMMEHISMKARMMVEQQIQQQMQQMQGQMQQQVQQLQMAAQQGMISPQDAQQQMMAMQQQMQQQMPQPAQVEAQIAQLQAQLMQELAMSLSPPPQDPAADPLVQIRMKEVGIKEMEVQQKADMDRQKLQLDAMKTQQKAATDAARIESTEEIAQDRAAVNRERIQASREASQRRSQ
jgi:hypothetical protein